MVHNMMAFFFYHVLNTKLFFSTCSKPILSKYNPYTMFNILWDAKSHLAIMIVFSSDKSHIISWLQSHELPCTHLHITRSAGSIKSIMCYK